MPNYDAADAVWAYLRADDDAVAVRALVLNGATNIVEAGDITVDRLDTWEQARGSAATVLAVSVQDGPEEAGQEAWLGTVIIRIYDRNRGNRNISAVRHVLLHDALRDFDAALEDSSLLRLRYARRTGHLYDLTRMVDFEALTYTTVVQDEESYD